jgi:DNA-binding transcriptional LysR family regulator
VGTSSEPGTRIGEIVSLLRANHPLINVDLMARPSSGARQGLASGELDVGVLLALSAEVGFTYYELTSVPYRVAGPAAWKEQIDEADWATLAQLPWLTPSGSSAYSGMLAQLFGNRGLELNSVLRFDNSSVGRAALEAGAGMMLLREDHAIQRELKGNLAVSPLARTEISLWAAHQAGRHADPLIKAFVEAAKVFWPQIKQASPRKA